MIEKQDLLDFWKEKFHFRKAELEAFRTIRREDFIPDKTRDFAYQDTPLPLIRGKTISQPTTVMIMTSALELRKGDKVFEVGTGSGFQTAIIAKIISPGKVISTEVLPELVQFAKENLRRARIENAFVFEEDGSQGMQNEAPFDKIIITAACKEFPKRLVEQLKVGGMIVAPVGSQNEQEMVKGIKTRDGKLELYFLGPFVFSSMYGKYGFEV